MKKRYLKGLLIISIFTFLVGCSSKEKQEQTDQKDLISQNSELNQDENTQNEDTQEDLSRYFKNIELATSYKGVLNNNPVMTQRFGADPYALVYDDTVYLYMTGDVFEYDAEGNVKSNSYGKVESICVIGSKDLVNWTDYGRINTTGNGMPASWAGNSWAPAITSKEVDGVEKFYLYFADGASGIVVLESDSPTGPYKSPLDNALINRGTPNCDTVAWLFDPAVLKDDDGNYYLYFGGGVPEGKTSDPGTIRVVKLGDDMISLDGDPQPLAVPYVFEDSGINKIGDTYYYSYCANWNVDDDAKSTLKIASAQICYMTSDSPMGPFKLQGAILRNPGDYFGVWGNNHHCIFQFKDQWYITYHSQILEKAMGYEGKGYRCTHIDKAVVNEDGSITMGKGTKEGVEQIAYLNPYVLNQAETICSMAGIETTGTDITSKYFGCGNMAVSDINTGDWLMVKGVDFGENGASAIDASVLLEEGKYGIIEIRSDYLKGTPIGYIEIKTGQNKQFETIHAELDQEITGVHDIYFVFYGEGYQWDTWQFIQEEK